MFTHRSIRMIAPLVRKLNLKNFQIYSLTHWIISTNHVVQLLGVIHNPFFMGNKCIVARNVIKIIVSYAKRKHIINKNAN